MIGSASFQPIMAEHRKKDKRSLNALKGMRTLRTEVADWQSRQAPASDAKSTSEIALSPELSD